MSEEELEQKLDLKNKPGIRTGLKKCRKKYNACKWWIFGKSEKSRRKAIATYPELKGCPLDGIVEEVVDTRGNMSPRMSKNIPFLPMLLFVLYSK